MAVKIKVRNYAGVCMAEYYLAYEKTLLLFSDVFSIMQAVNKHGTDC